ncbi:MAG: hypothetical protein ACOYL6_15565 [Bacteriovoracaceae bacterium]
MGASRIKQLIGEEELAAMKGQLISSNDIQNERVNKGNYRLAQGLSYLVDDKWEQIRTSIACGKFNEAKDRLNTLDQNDLMTKQESAFELARISCYEGEFQKALDILIPLIQDDQLNPLTLMTALQLQALALLETGEFLQCLEITETILVLETLFPGAQASLFGRVTRSRALQQVASKEEVEREVVELWRRISSGVYGMNKPLQLIMYCRLQCKLRIQEKNPYTEYAMAGLKLSQKMNSPLHIGFFLLDLLVAGDSELSRYAMATLPPYLEKFQCLRFFHSKLFAGPEIPSSGVSKFLTKEPQDILFSEEGFLYSLTNDSLIELKMNEKTKSILAEIKNNQVDKEVIFKKVWQAQHFNLLNNDSSVRTALKRVRAECGINVTSQSMLLEIPETLIV